MINLRRSVEVFQGIAVIAFWSPNVISGWEFCMNLELLLIRCAAGISASVDAKERFVSELHGVDLLHG